MNFQRRHVLAGLAAGLGGAVAGCSGPAPVARCGAAAAAWPNSMGCTPDAPPDAALQQAIVPAARTADPYAPLAGALNGIARNKGDARALVVFIGDSHTAGWMLVERLRELMQARFGAAGLGRLPPGRPARTGRPAGVQLDQQGEWTRRTALRAGTPGPFGLSGQILAGSRAGDITTLRVDDPEGFDRIHLAFMSNPAGGSMRVGVDGTWTVPFSTRLAEPGARLARQDVPRGSRELAIELVGNGPVELLSWGVDRRGSGVLVEGFGINGATLASLDNRDPRTFARELQVAPPALLVLQFGTNEATDRDFDAELYAEQLRRQIRALRRTMPGSGVLVMGPPDAGRPARGLPGCGGVSPLPALAQVRAVQRRVAAAEGAAFFDWGAEVTQGPCRLPRLAHGSDPILRPDLVHFTPLGYRLSADRFYAHLMARVGLRDPVQPI
jgi:lysophospholipase L1-like esterase